MNCIVRFSFGSVGGRDWYGSPFTHRRSSLNLALQRHLCWWHMQGSSHGGTVFSGGLLLYVPAFMRTQHRDFFDSTISFRNSHTALLCLLVLRACMWCCEEQGINYASPFNGKLMI